MFLKFKYEPIEDALDLSIVPCRKHMRAMYKYEYAQRLLFPRQIDCPHLSKFMFEHVMYKKLRIYVQNEQAAKNIVFNLQKDIDMLWEELTQFIDPDKSCGSYIEFNKLHNMQASENPIENLAIDATPTVRKPRLVFSNDLEVIE